jgi:hypothetical protein
VLRLFEDRIPREHQARLSLELDESGVADDQEIRNSLSAAGLVIVATRVLIDGGTCRELVYDVRRTRRWSDDEMPAALRALVDRPGVAKLQRDTLRGP